MPTPSDSDLLVFDGWPGGVNNRIRETEKGRTEGNRNKSIDPSLSLRAAVNVDLTQFGHPIRRKGYSKVLSGYSHSLWSAKHLPYMLCVNEGRLCVLRDEALTPICDIHPYARVTYCTVNGAVYWANGLQRGRVVDGELYHWGLPSPAVAKVTTGPGSLYEGRYTVALTYIDEFDEEYGASDPVVCDVSGSLDITIPGNWPHGATAVAVYVSQPDGEVLYRIGEYPSSGVVSVAVNMLGVGMELETQNLKAPPSGKLIRYFNGRIYISRHNTVVFTEPLRYGLTRPAQGLYMFPSEPLLLETVADGVYVGTQEGVVFIQGTDPYDVRQINVLSHAPVPRAVTHVPGEFLDSGESTVPVWWGVDGAMVAGLPGGQVVQLSKDRLAVPEFAQGAMMYREHEGMAHVVSSLGRGGEASAMGATDTAVAEIRQSSKKLNV